MRNLLVLRCSLVLLPFLLTASPLSAAPKKIPSFAAVVRTHFAGWDRDHDGKLSPAEVMAVVADPAVTGNAAAASAAIHVFQRVKKHRNIPLTLKFLTADHQGEDGRRRDKPEDAPNFQDDYEDFVAHIAESPRVLFTSPRAPTLEGISQGELGDCYFLCAVGAAVARDSSAIRGLFHPNPDGTCTLRFPGERVVHETKLTDAEIALGSSAGRQGLWLNVLEKSFGAMHVKISRTGKASSMSLDTIADGGDADRAIEVLTGHKAETIAIRQGEDNHLPGAKEMAILEGKVRKRLQIAAQRRLLICCGTPEGHVPPGMVDDHDYAILGYDRASDTVHLWNPWGNDFTPKGPPGLKAGYPTRGGHFYMPLKDLLQVADEVYYETLAPAPFRKKE
jgi:hypothetical protein